MPSLAIGSLPGLKNETWVDWGSGTMMRRIFNLGEFFRKVRVQARFGKLSRAPLRLLQVQVCGETAECDWVARPADKWDSGLPSLVGERNASLQALEDAILVRSLLFRAIPHVSTAVFHVYRESASGSMSLIIEGSVSRGEQAPKAVRSIVMRARLLGLRFWLDNGILESLQPEASSVGT